MQSKPTFGEIRHDLPVNVADVRHAVPARSIGEGSAPEVDLVIVGDAAPRPAGEQREPLAPLRGLDRDEPVIVALDQPHNPVRRGEVDVREGRAHHARKALIPYPGHIRVGAVERLRPRRGKVPAHGEEIRLRVADQTDPVVHREGREVKQRIRRLQQAVDRLRAPVRRPDRRDARDLTAHSQRGRGHARLQPALGVRDDVHLLRAGLVENLPDARFDGFGIFLHARPVSCCP